MNRPLKIVGYLFLGIFVFLFFVYWTFPYDLVKERIVASIEKQMGGSVSVSVEKLSPSWFTGVKIKGMKLEARTADGILPLWQAEKVKMRVGLFSLIFGQPKAKFSIRSKGSRVSGVFQRVENGFLMELDLDPLDLAEIGYLKSSIGMQLAGNIAGKMRLQMNTAQVAQSQGQIQFAFKDWRIRKGSKISLGAAGEMEIKEDLIITKGSESGLKVNIAKGTAEIGSFRFAGGDLDIDLKGQAFLSQKLANVRMNVNGAFKTTPKTDQVLPFLFMLEKQKQPDGSYPLTVAGNLTKPQIKIGDFPLSF